MPTRERVAAFVAKVEAGDYVEAIEQFYAEDATMQENLGPIRRGIATLVEGEKQALGRSDIKCRPVEVLLVDGDHVVVRWVFEMTPRAGGAMRVFDELALQRWSDDRIVEERFYYDPAQMAPPS